MLIYQYPPKVDRTTRQMQEFNASLERKKYKKDALKNLCLAFILVVISFFVPFVPVKILLIVFTVFYVFLSYLIFHYGMFINSSKIWTKVYDDRIENSQLSALMPWFKVSVVYFEDIESSYQNVVGDLCFKLKDGYKSKVEVSKKNTIISQEIKNNELSLHFSDTQPKLFIINEFYEKIKYPKKEYREIVDEDEDEY